MARKIYTIENLDCANCAAKIEAKISALPQVQEAVITFTTRQLRLTAEDPDALIPQLQALARTVDPEVVITVDEETGMFGANGLPEGELNGDILINLDSEHWGKFVIGSAGGINITATLDYKEVETDPEDAAVRVTLKGLMGGG